MTYSELAPDREQANRLAIQVVGGGCSESRSPNTVASYCSSMRYWFAWYQLRFGGEMMFPVSEKTIVQFIADHAALPAATRDAIANAGVEVSTTERADAAREGPLPSHLDQMLVDAGFKAGPGLLTLGTLTARLAALSSVHQSMDSKNPCSHVDVRNLMAAVRQQYAKHGVAANHVRAFTQEAFEAMLATCDDSPIGKRDRALLLFALEGGGRRRSEVASATMENLRRVAPENYVYLLFERSTGRQVVSEKPLTGRTALALNAWLEIRGIAGGPLFPSIRKNGKCSMKELRPDSVGRTVKKRCQKAGLPNEYSAHSLRSGFVAEAGRRKMSIDAAMELSGHRDFVTFARHYFRDEENLVVIDLMADADRDETRGPLARGAKT